MKQKILSLIISVACVGALSAQEVTSESPWIRDYLTPIPDFPKEGIVFQWYAKLLQDPDAFHKTIETFAARYQKSNLDAIVGLDARGFIFGAALAYELRLPFVMVRKLGKLPAKVERIDYELEYGKNGFEIEINSLKTGSRVLIIDDVLATGGTARAASELLERLGATVVESAFLIELPALHGRDKLKSPVYSLLSIDGK